MNKRSVGALVVLANALAGCQLAQPAATTPAPTPTLSPTVSPTATASPPPVTSAPPTPTAQAADPCAGSTADNPATPPDVNLTGSDATVVTGRLGSYTYCDTAADALPPRAENLTAIVLSADVALSLSSDAPDLIAAYQAGYWPAIEWQGDEIRYAAADLTSPSSETTFAAPPGGDWMLAVNLTFASGGEALYYWHVTVP